MNGITTQAVAHSQTLFILMGHARVSHLPRMALETARVANCAGWGVGEHLRDSLAGLAGNQQSCPSKRGNSQQGHSSLWLALATLA